MVNLITGVLAPSAGADPARRRRHHPRSAQAARVKRGLARTFQINQLFRGLTVLENVALALAEREGVAGDHVPRRRLARRAASRRPTRCSPLGIATTRCGAVHELAYGEQRLVEIAIALGAASPRCCCWTSRRRACRDRERASSSTSSTRLPADIAVLIIEHDMDLVFRFARRITVLVQGEVLSRAARRRSRADPRVREVYLGERRHG